MKPWMRYVLIVIEVVLCFGLLFLVDYFGLLSSQKITQSVEIGLLCATFIVAHRTLGYFWMHSIILGMWLFVIFLWYMIILDSSSSAVNFLYYVVGVAAVTSLKDYTYGFLHLTLRRRR
jgi:hypothetical protein